MMATRNDAPIGAPIWVDLLTSDVERTRPFYEQIFGWEAQEPNPDFGGYFIFLKDGGQVAGGIASEEGNPSPDGWTTYLATADAKVTADAVVTHGGQVQVPPMDLPELGTMAITTDPGGATVGMWEPKSHRGFLTYGEPGWPSWFDLQTRDYAGCVDFYRGAFGWTTNVLSDTEEFRYTTLKTGELEWAGIMDCAAFLPEGAPSRWTVVFGAADTDATVDQVLGLGGAVVRPAADSPYGRLATVSDPTGAEFALISGR